jgi:hypothetical protein
MSVLDNQVNSFDIADSANFDTIKETEYIYLYHETNPDNKKAVTVGASLRKADPISQLLHGAVESDSTIINNQSGIMIKAIDSPYSKHQLNAFDFITNYLEVYANRSDIYDLHKPLEQKNFDEWTQDPIDKDVFARYFDLTINPDDNASEDKFALNAIKLQELLMLSKMANYFGMNMLLNKVACLIAKNIGPFHKEDSEDDNAYIKKYLAYEPMTD